MKKPYILALVSLLLCLSLTLCGCGEGVAPEQLGGTNDPAVYTLPITIGQADDALLSNPDAYHHFTDDTAANNEWQIVFTTKQTVQDFRFIAVDEAEALTAGEALYSMDALTPNKPFVASTYLNDATANCGISFVDATGTQRYYAIRFSGKDGALSLSEFTTADLSEQQLAEIETYLNEPENNGLVGSHLYEEAEDVDLLYALYDGGGLDGWVEYADWSEAEKQAILTDEFRQKVEHKTVHITPRKIDHGAIVQFFHEKLGRDAKALPIWEPAKFPVSIRESCVLYNSDYDCFYMFHGDDAYMSTIEVLSGEQTADGLVHITYTTGATYQGQPAKYVVTLQKTENGYQFVSNVAANAASDTAPDYTTPGPLALSGDTADFIHGTWKVEKLLCFGFSYDNKSEYPIGQDVIGNEIVIHTDRFSSAGLVQYPRYQAEVANPYYSARVTYNGEMFRQEYRVALPDVDANDQVTVIHVSTERTKPNLPPVFYTVNNERLILMLDSAYFELTQVGD